MVKNKIPCTTKREKKEVAKEKVNKYYQKLFSKCKREWSFHSPIKVECATLAREKVGTVYKWWCNHCNGKFAWSEIDFDHIDPIKISTPRTLAEFLYCIEKQNCALDNLQVLCKPCHKIKTKSDLTKDDRMWMISELNSYFTKTGITAPSCYLKLNMEQMEFKELKRLHNIVLKIKSLIGKTQESWRKKLVAFLKEYE